MPAIQTITDSLLIEAIDNAKKRLVFVAPGVWPEVANSIASAWQRLGAESVSVILDVEAEVCRLGFGDLKGLQILQRVAKQFNQALGHQPGVRICILMADQQTFIFSPTARLIETLVEPSADSKKRSGQADLFSDESDKIEDSPKKEQSRPNGIVINTDLIPVSNELGVGVDGAAERKLGLEPVQQDKVDTLIKDLDDNPPKEFDLSRAVNVYNAKIRFVELEAKGYRISQHKVSLPKSLVHVVKENSKLSGKINAALHLIGEEDNLAGDGASEESVEKIRKEINKDFLRPVVGVGSLLLRSDIDKFEVKVELLKKELKDFALNITNSLSDRYRQTADELAIALLSGVMEAIPDHWKRYLSTPPDEQEVKFKIKEVLLRSFGDPAKRISKMVATLVYKDVTYDMLKDEHFAQAVAEHFPDIQQFEEYAAAAERTSPKSK